MYETILLPTDGSVGMASAIEQCLHQAELHDATVHAIYVVDVRAYVMLPEETQTQVASVLEQQGRTTLEYLSDLAAERGVDIVTHLLEGVPADAILQYADEHEADLVVMGTHGRTGETHRIVGSVAEEVVRHAEMPVLTVRKRAEDADAAGDHLFEDVDAEVPTEQRRYIG